MLTPTEVMKMIVKALDSKKALDIKVLRTEKITILADYFVICTATSSTHVKSLADEAEKVLTENGEPPHRKEGYGGGGWLLVDFGCVIVHVFTEETRKFYSLERLWSDATPIDISAIVTD